MSGEQSAQKSLAGRYLISEGALAASSFGDIKKGYLIGIVQRNEFYAFIVDKDGDSAQQTMQFYPKMIYYGLVALGWILRRPYISRESWEHVRGADPRCAVKKEIVHNVYLIKSGLEARIRELFQTKQKPTFLGMKH